MQAERTKNSIYNGASNLIINITSAILSFVVRTIFIRKLGEQCLGLDGLFTNIISMLSLVELGVNTALAFNLYEPLAKHDVDRINRLMSFFKKFNRFICFSILGFGLCILPFLKFLAKDYTIDYNIYFIFLLYLANTAFSYLLVYCYIIIEADQKNYKLTPIKIVFNFLTYGFQIFVLLLTNNFILYLLVQFILRYIERICLFKFIKKEYSFVDFDSKEKISKEDKNILTKNIKSLIFHRVGAYAVNGTDNILIASIVSISATGFYSNYLSITGILKNLVASIINGTTSSFGNLNISESDEIKENSFNLVNFVCYSVTGLFFVGLICCFKPFITLWIGDKYNLSFVCVLFICINFYLASIILSVDAVKNSAGLYHNDRFVPIIQAIINLAISIIFGIKFGLIGILLGTTVSSILTVNVVKPIIIYKNIFHTAYKKYFIYILKNVLTVAFSVMASMFVFKYLNSPNIFITLILNGVVSCSIYCLLFVVTNFYTTEFKYFKNLLMKK